ncbi:CU044_2847 family protein [Streptomyces sp. NPDC048258]|uniref:CU044_2847 family protein n=1 Tax=Streptomyces sp. NPDC048258 TaxID=3365527 RepID=UPI00371C5F0C
MGRSGEGQPHRRRRTRIASDAGGALEPVTEAARAILGQLRKAHPDQITVEFGVDLAFEAGTVITKSQASCHLKVTVTRVRADPGEQRGEEAG